MRGIGLTLSKQASCLMTGQLGGKCRRLGTGVSGFESCGPTAVLSFEKIEKRVFPGYINRCKGNSLLESVSLVAHHTACSVLLLESSGLTGCRLEFQMPVQYSEPSLCFNLAVHRPTKRCVSRR